MKAALRDPVEDLHGQLNLLRGLVEQQRGRPREAIVFLEQAQKQLPDSIAVQALLAQACLEDGQVRRWDDLGKVAGLKTPALAEYRGLIEEFALHAPG